MPDLAAKWQVDFQQAHAVVRKLHGELEQWEQQNQGERGRQGAAIRGKASQQKVVLERLRRELSSLSDNPAENEVTRKTITQQRDELAQVFKDLEELLRRMKTLVPNCRPPQAVAGLGSSATVTVNSSPASSFARVGDGSTVDTAKTPKGAELPQMSHHVQLARQQMMMRDLEAPLNDIEGTVDNLQRVSRMIHREIQDQNSMLENTNALTDRATSRIGRTKALLERFMVRDRNRCLMCLIVLVLAALITILVFVTGSKLG